MEVINDFCSLYHETSLLSEDWREREREGEGERESGRERERERERERNDLYINFVDEWKGREKR